MRTLPIALVSLLIATAPLSAQEAIRLTFDWEPGLRGTVTQTMDQSSGTAGMQVQQRTVTRHSIETADHPEGLVIRFRDGEVLESTMPTAEGVPGAEDFTRAVWEASYDVIVDEEGNLVRIERDEATMERLRAALDEMIEPLRSMPGAEGMTGMFEEMMSEGALNAEAEQNWTSSVGLWAGDEVVVGETYTSREEAPFPMMENRTLVMDVETTLEGRTACVEGGPADACVRLVVSSSADPADVRGVMEEMFGRMFADAPAEMEISLGEFDQTSVVEAVLEPETLLPHTVTVTSNADIEMTVMGQTMPMVQEMEMVTEYAWEGR